MKIISVFELNRIIQNELSLIPILNRVKVKGEVGRITKHRSGHYYFNLKDDSATIDCVMFKSSVLKLKEDFNEGDKVFLKGRISIYEQNARLQLYVTDVELDGIGENYKRFLILKEKLEKEGLFNENHKKKILSFPNKVALISSNTSAAKADFVRIFKAKNPLATLDVYDSLMQSNEAIRDIINILEEIDGKYDLIVITRGGGSYEDLFVFNDEELARKVFSLKTPIISGIGHEIDFTIIEFVSDKRAQTPTEAAELSTLSIKDYLNDYYEFLKEYKRSKKTELEHKEKRLVSFYENMRFNITNKISYMYKNLDNDFNVLNTSIKNILKMKRQNLEENISVINELNPLNIMKKGYAYLQKEDKKVESIKDIELSDVINARLYDGKIDIKVVKKDEL